jgi:hypothetical protein
MMTDYSNWREWKEVELWEYEEYFQEHEEYSPEDVKNICDVLLQKGDAAGLQGCYLKFKSNTDPYEDWLGPPSVCVVGYRKPNSNEQKEMREDDAIRAMAKELNITEYEARMLKQLKDKGVV